MYGIVAQSQSAADQAKAAWKLDFEQWSDPEVEVAEHMNACGMARIEIDSDLAHMFAGELSGGPYAKAVTQPGIVVVAKGRPKTALVSWCSVPSEDNVGGAMGRPTAEETLEAVQAALAGESGYQQWEPASSLGRQLPLPNAVFLLALFANGNFIAPRPFVLDHEGRGDPRKPLLFSLGKGAVVLGSSAVLACAKGGKVAGAVLGLWSVWGAYAYISYGDMLRKGWKVGSTPAKASL